MQNKWSFFILGIILWVGFGAIIGSFSATILSYTWIAQAVLTGAAIGSIVGLGLGLAGLLVAAWVRAKAVMLWMLGGSLIGAAIGFKSVVIFGGYPQGNQGDLGFITLAPAGLGVGAVLGTIVGLLFWKYRHPA
jgi:hypothetical protein